MMKTKMKRNEQTIGLDDLINYVEQLAEDMDKEQDMVIKDIMLEEWNMVNSEIDNIIDGLVYIQNKNNKENERS